VGGPDVRMDQYSPYGKAVAHALDRGNDVRSDPMVLEGKERPTSSISGLHFIGDEQAAVSPALFCDEGKEFPTGPIQSAHPLYGFQDHGTVFPGGDGPFKGPKVVQGKEIDLLLSVDRRVDSRIVRNGHCGRGPAVEAVRKG